ncbi:MAG: hypothetical protein CMO40_09730 [Verrucomicrobiaceae bacterium]|nr:hypothetical protein [Verrucomicrobiaceae bacterium]
MNIITIALSRLLAPALGVLCLSVPALAQQGEKKGPDLASLKKAAFAIDKHVANLYKRKKLQVPGVVDDATFLRRSFLVAAGRIPTLDEARMFLEIEDENKRAMLASYLMSDKNDGYRSTMVNWVSDLLRLTDDFNEGQAAPYVQFVHEAMRNNMPWNEFAHSLLSAKGSGWAKDNGAVGYFIRDKGMALDNLSNTMRIFTGERMECAQCHDAPFHKWDRMEFFELAAFTNGQEEMNRGPWDSVWRDVRSANDERTEFGRLMEWLGDNVHYFTLGGGGKGRIKLPSDYQYRDGDPGEMIGGKTHFGKRIRSSDRRDDDYAREDFARWMVTANDNFTSVIVNRMWKRIMGKGIYEPVDEYIDADKTITPELMDYLMTLLRDDLQYDLRAFQHVLLLTRNFQFEANPQAFDAGMPQAFNGRQIERMSAEQVWDSLVTLTAGNPDELPKRRFSDTVYYGGKPVLVGKKNMAQLSAELLAINKPGEYRDYVNRLLSEIKAGNSGASREAMMSMQRAGRPGPATGMARASELSAPAPNGHLLRNFGSSDRDLIDSATREPNMAQVLSIMNGYVEKMVVSNRSSAVYKALEAGTSDRDKVRFLYYSILSRSPTPDEMSLLMRDVIDGSKESYENLTSALISTHEFIFVQ